MSSTPGAGPPDGEVDDAPNRARVSPVWPVGQRVVLTAAVLAAALALVVAGRSADRAQGDAIESAIVLKLDPNSAPPQVLGALPHVGPSLVRKLALARQIRPLTSLEDVRRRVRGVGPATLAQIAPFLTFDSVTQSTVDQATRERASLPSKKQRATIRKQSRSPKPAATPAPTKLVARSTG
jgi:competence protein ComEA